ncbi:beta/gamma crystallin domain-containing protein [Kitasatospora sp. NPDC088391]|uniref:beta/gamma crystallin domain-containing protein n=1 Tax=Kitasatospora sp. NPDC088391 TaxID=3364074 RepID=UPI0038209D79
MDTSTCNSRSDFFTLWNYPPKVCFAGDGYTGVGIYDVYQVDSGNNSGSYGGVWGGSNTTVYFSSWKTRTFSPGLNVTYINVTGR